ncbi:MAG: glycosyltransferase [Bacteroidales bacterium]|nr:glycosyltransferase [Bacteroidales bacterium]
MKQNQKALIILTDIDLDNKSGASWNRILNYSKAISTTATKVLITSAIYNKLNEEEIEQYSNNVYILKSKSQNYTNKKVIPILKDIRFRRDLNYLREIVDIFHKGQDQSRFLLYPSNFSLSFITLFYLKIYKKRVVFIEKNELHFAKALNLPFPSSLHYKMLFPFIWSINLIPSFLTDFIEQFFDGMICISTRMEGLYKKLNNNTIRIPILADTDMITIIQKKMQWNDCFRIAYAGTISNKRDGVLSFIKSICLLKHKKIRIEVNLYGPITRSEKLHLNKTINDYQLTDIVKYHGNLPAQDITNMLKLQNLLILPRPLNLQTNFGFSTKLAEYLNSGVPVLSTKISDAEMYLTDRNNIYFIDTLRPKDIAIKIDEIINNKNLNSKIAKAALIANNQHFSYKNYSFILNDFLFHAS